MKFKRKMLVLTLAGALSVTATALATAQNSNDTTGNTSLESSVATIQTIQGDLDSNDSDNNSDNQNMGIDIDIDNDDIDVDNNNADDNDNQNDDNEIQGTTFEVADIDELKTALGDAVDGDIIKLTENIEVDMSAIAQNEAAIRITKAITLDGNDKTLQATVASTENSSLLGIESSAADGAIVKNLNINGSVAGDEDSLELMVSRHGINVYVAQNITLENVEIANCGGYGIVINGSTVQATNIGTTGNGWGGVNVSQGSGIVQIPEFTLISGSFAEANKIYADYTNVQIDKVVLPDSWYTYIKESGKEVLWSETKPTIFNSSKAYGYLNIELAISEASAGETIKLSQNVDEQIILNKAINLVADGENVNLKGGIYLDASNESFADGKTLIQGFIIGEDATVETATEAQVIRNYNGDVPNLTISDNTIYGGIHLGNLRQGDPIWDMTNLEISNNTIFANRQGTNSAINAWNVQNVQITGNTIEEANYCGINLYGTSGRVTNNIIKNYATDSVTYPATAALKFDGNTALTVTGNEIAYFEDRLAVYAGAIDEADSNNDDPIYTNVDLSNNFFNTDTPNTKIEDGSTVIFGELATEAPTVSEKVESSLSELNENSPAETVNIVAKEIALLLTTVEDIAADETLVANILKLDELLIAANDTINVASATVNTDDIEENFQMATTEVDTVPQGLAFAYLGGSIPAENTSFYLDMTQTAGTSTSQIVEIKPFYAVGDKATEIGNDQLNGAITFNIPLHENITTSNVTVVHKDDVGNVKSTKTVAVQNINGAKFVPVTVTGFSEFQISQVSTSSSSTKYYNVVLSYEGDGKIMPTGGTNSTIRASQGSNYDFKFTPDAGYEVTDVLIDGESVGAVDSYYMTNIRSAKTVHVVFSEIGADKDAEVEDTTAKTDFKDVVVGAWYEDYIAQAVEAGIMQGTSTTTFVPNGTSTRAMMVTVLHNMSDKPEVSTNEDKWYSEAQAWAMSTGISDGTNMEDNITREQLVTMVYRYAMDNDFEMAKNGDLTKYGDYESVSSYATDAFKWAIGAGIINGDNGNLKPQDNATRAELAKIMVCFLDQI